ncbi:MAG: hypothetical protein STSR0008_23820 [Ignavibacterium sp.]
MKVKDMSFDFPEKPYKSEYEIILSDAFQNLKNFESGKMVLADCEFAFGIFIILMLVVPFLLTCSA